MQIKYEEKGMKMKTVLLLIAIIALSSCVSSPYKGKITKENIGNSLEARKYSNIYFSGQPSTDDLKKLKADGFALVINLREHLEHNEAEEKK